MIKIKINQRKTSICHIMLMLVMCISLLFRTSLAEGSQPQKAKLVSINHDLGTFPLYAYLEPNAYYSEAWTLLNDVRTSIQLDDGRTLEVEIDWNWSQYGLPDDDPIMFSYLLGEEKEFVGLAKIPNDIDTNGMDLTVHALVKAENAQPVFYEVMTLLNDYNTGRISPPMTGVPENEYFPVILEPYNGYEIEMVLVNDMNYMNQLEKDGDTFVINLLMDENKAVWAYYKKAGTASADSYDLTTNAISGGGNISESKSNLPKDSQETLIITPDEGYEIDALEVNGADKTALVENNSLKIVMDFHKFVSVSFKEKSSGAEASESTSGTGSSGDSGGTGSSGSSGATEGSESTGGTGTSGSSGGTGTSGSSGGTEGSEGTGGTGTSGSSGGAGSAGSTENTENTGITGNNENIGNSQNNVSTSQGNSSQNMDVNTSILWFTVPLVACIAFIVYLLIRKKGK